MNGQNSKPRRAKLQTIGDCSKFLARVINMAYRKEMDPGLASRIAYMTNVQINALKDSALEERVSKLEKGFVNGNAGNANQKT